MDELYKIASDRERLELDKFFKRFTSINDVFYTDGNVVYDAIVNNSIIVETKVRDVNDYIFNLVKNEGVLLEKFKYDNLIKKRQKLGMKKIFYINFFPKQGLIYLFDLDNIKLNLSIKKCNKQTYSARLNKIDKEVYLLNIIESKSYAY